MGAQPVAARSRVDARRAESRADVAALQAEVDEWNRRWAGSVALRAHTGHVTLVTSVVSSLVADVAAAIDSSDGAEPGGVYVALRALDVPLLYARRLWQWYADKLDSRLAPGGAPRDPLNATQLALLGADEVVWGVWHTVLGSLGGAVGPAPLPYLAALETPTATPPEQFPADLRPSIDPRVAALVSAMPVTIIGVPPGSVRRPWTLALLAHETGPSDRGHARPARSTADGDR